MFQWTPQLTATFKAAPYSWWLPSQVPLLLRHHSEGSILNSSIRGQVQPVESTSGLEDSSTPHVQVPARCSPGREVCSSMRKVRLTSAPRPSTQY